MSLVAIEEFNGTENGNAVIEALVMVGAVGKLRGKGYTLDITGIQPITPTGYLEDCPDSHEIEISKIKYLGKSKDLGYVKYTNKVDKESKDYKEVIETNREENLKLVIGIGKDIKEEDRIQIDNDGNTWYVHTISFKTEKGDKTDEEYVVYMFNGIADSILRGHKGEI